MCTRNEIFHICVFLKILLLSNTLHIQFEALVEVANRCAEMKLIHVTMFSAKLLILFWILDAFLVAQYSSIMISPSRHELFPNIIRRSKCALNLYIDTCAVSLCL